MEKKTKSIDTASLTISADFPSESSNAKKAVKIVEDPKNDKVMETYDHNAIAVSMVQFQVEYHFSDSNLEMDNYLLCRMHEDKEYWVPVTTIANLTKIKAITEDLKIVLKAIRSSDKLILNEDESKVKRPNFIPPKPKHHKNLRRTIFIYGIPKNYTDKEILKICSEYGKVKSIAFDVDIEKESENKNEKTKNDDDNDKQNDDKNEEKKDAQKETEEGEKKPEKKPEESQKQKENNDQREEKKSEKKPDESPEKEKNNDQSEEKKPESDKIDIAEKQSEKKQQETKNEEKPPIKTIALKDILRPDHSIAITIMTKKFGPKAVRSNSSFTVTNRASTHSNRMSNDRVQHAATHSHVGGGSNSFDFAVEVVPPHAPVFVHPVPNPNGDPLDFSHLKSCFVVFQSQSQANKCVKNRARAEDGIRAMTQYDYNQFKKRVSLAKARGISPLMSPNSIGLALTSPTFALLGSQRHAQQTQRHSHEQYLQTPNNNNYAQYQYQAQNVDVAAQAHNAMAMEYYLANSQVTLTMSELQQLIEKMQKNPLKTAPNRSSWHHTRGNPKSISRSMMGNKYNQPRRNTHHHQHQQYQPCQHHQYQKRNSNYNQKQNFAQQQPRSTWSHRQQSQQPKIFDFGNSKQQNKQHHYRHSHNHHKQHQYHHSGSKTTTNRYKSRSSAKSYHNRRKTDHSNNGRFPPAPTPNNSFGRVMNQPTIVMTSKTPIPAFPQSQLLSPGLSPHMTLIRGPAEGCGILDRSN